MLLLFLAMSCCTISHTSRMCWGVVPTKTKNACCLHFLYSCQVHRIDAHGHWQSIGNCSTHLLLISQGAENSTLLLSRTGLWSVHDKVNLKQTRDTHTQIHKHTRQKHTHIHRASEEETHKNTKKITTHNSGTYFMSLCMIVQNRPRIVQNVRIWSNSGESQ